MYTFQLIIDLLVISKNIVSNHHNIVVIHWVKTDITAYLIVQVDMHKRRCFFFLKRPEDQLVVGWACECQQQFVIGLGERYRGVILALGFGTELKVTFELVGVEVVDGAVWLVHLLCNGQLLAVV